MFENPNLITKPSEISARKWLDGVQGQLCRATNIDAQFQEMSVVRVIRESPDCRTFELEPVSLDIGFSPIPGQYVPIRVEIDGILHQRHYAVSSLVAYGEAPAISVRRVPGGVVSNWFHSALRPGMTVQVGRPMGDFVLDDTEELLLFFAAGIGIAPILPLVRHALASGNCPIVLTTINRSSFDAAFLVKLRKLTEIVGNRLKLVELYSNTDGFQKFDALPSHLGAPNSSRAYICGPAAFMRKAHVLAMQMDLAPDRIVLNTAIEIG